MLVNITFSQVKRFRVDANMIDEIRFDKFQGCGCLENQKVVFKNKVEQIVKVMLLWEAGEVESSMATFI